MDEPSRPKAVAITVWYANRHRLLERCDDRFLTAAPQRLDVLNALLGLIALQQIKQQNVSSLRGHALAAHPPGRGDVHFRGSIQQQRTRRCLS